MLISGAVLLAVAVVAIVVGLVQRRRVRQMAAAETLTSARLREEVDASAGGGAGQFSKVCEVTGVAQAGPDGPLVAPLSGVSCVWHRQVVRRRYLRNSSDGNGGQRQQRRTEVVSDISSPALFTLDDGTGRVLVAPDGTAIDRPERVHEEFRQDLSGPSLTALGVTVRLGNSGGTLGFETEEWAVRAGTRLYVLGEVSDRDGQLRVGKPDRGNFIISTRTEAELTTRANRIQYASLAIGGLAGVAGAVLLALGVA